MKRSNAAYDILASQSLCTHTPGMEATQPLRGTLYLFLSLSSSLSLALGNAEAFSEMEGSYSYTTSENYDDFLKERGVPWIGRKLIIAAPVQLEVGGIRLISISYSF